MSPPRTVAERMLAAWHARGFVLKAVSFGFVGLINMAVDFGVFFLTRAVLLASDNALVAANAVTAACDCLDAETWILVPANITAWLVAVSGSYVMNSFTTFARESGRKLRWRDYGKFVTSGIAGAIANTTTVVVVSQFADVLWAKAAATLVGFVVNFSLSHFVVFRPRA
jgi:putative flippase GtrA